MKTDRIMVESTTSDQRLKSSDPRLQLMLRSAANQGMDVDQRRAVNAILQHDRESSSAELVYYFVHELGVAERAAWQAVATTRFQRVRV